MPILAEITRDQFTSKAVNVQPDDDRRLEFEGVDGSSLIDWSGEEFIARSGLLGVDVPPRDVIVEQVLGMPGARLREIRDLQREVFVPVTVRAADQDYRSVLKQLAAVRAALDYRTSDYVANEGTFDLAGYSVNGRRTIRCTYLEGLEGDYGPDVAFSSWRILGLRLLAVNPYCKGGEWSTPTLSVPSTLPFLSNDPAAHPWGLSPSTAIGPDMQVQVTGDVPTPPIAELVGPSDLTRITSPSGLDVTVGPIAAGQQLVIDLGQSCRRRRVLLDGVPTWSLLGDSPQWRDFAPGEASLSIVMTGASTLTRARVYGDELWETLW